MTHIIFLLDSADLKSNPDFITCKHKSYVPCKLLSIFFFASIISSLK